MSGPKLPTEVRAAIVHELQVGQEDVVLVQANALGHEALTRPEAMTLFIVAHEIPPTHASYAEFLRREHVPLRDLASMPPDVEQWTRTAATETAARVVADLRAGISVLVMCHSGLNRSGLVCGLAMVMLGLTPEQAIEAIRERRGPWALHNAAFEGIIRASAKGSA